MSFTFECRQTPEGRAMFVNGHPFSVINHPIVIFRPLDYNDPEDWARNIAYAVMGAHRRSKQDAIDAQDYFARYIWQNLPHDQSWSLTSEQVEAIFQEAEAETNQYIDDLFATL